MDQVVTYTLPEDSIVFPKADRDKAIIPDKTSDLKNLSEMGGLFYKTSESLVMLNAATVEMPSDFLQVQKEGLEHLKSQSNAATKYMSHIEKYNNFMVLVRSYDAKDLDLSYIKFTALSNRRKGVVSGIVEYSVSDKIKVNKMLEDFFKGLKFKI